MMCYKLIIHTLHCDVRPLIAVCDDITKPLVDPYAVPKPCYCKNREQEIRNRLRCEYGHSCCYMTAEQVRCRKENCEQVVRFHKYIRRDISREAFFERGPAKDDEGWAPLPVIDEEFCDLCYAPCSTAEFARARESFLKEAKGLYEIMTQIRKTEAEIRQKSIHMMSLEHQSCLFLERNWEQVCGQPTLNDWQCDAEQDFEDLDSELEVLEGEAEAQRETLLDHYFRVVELEEEGQGAITNLEAWE